ncbi:DMT family transporter [Nonomuraea sp. NPDC049152]|uniref:DMT family transporter n=1 Tax=Nonomuraea sp. NPDC049152 TaxID=3154350 RepID=UPI0033F460C7
MGVLWCLVSAVGFGLSPIFAKGAYQSGVSVTEMLTGRFVIAAVVLWAVCAWRRPALPTSKVLFTAVGLGGIGYAVQALCYFGAVARIDASLAALLLYTFPALVTALAVALRRESLDRRKLAALGCSAVGLVLLLGLGGVSEGGTTGVLLALGAAVAYSIYLTVADGLPADVDVYLLSAIVCTAAAITMGFAGGFQLPGTAEGWLWTGLLGLISTVLAMATLFVGVRLLGAPTAAILSCAEPVVTLVSTSLVYGESLTPGQLAGGVAVLAAVLVLRLNLDFVRQRQLIGGNAPDTPVHSGHLNDR